MIHCQGLTLQVVVDLVNRRNASHLSCTLATMHMSTWPPLPSSDHRKSMGVWQVVLHVLCCLCCLTPLEARRSPSWPVCVSTVASGLLHAASHKHNTLLTACLACSSGPWIHRFRAHVLQLANQEGPCTVRSTKKLPLALAVLQLFRGPGCACLLLTGELQLHGVHTLCVRACKLRLFVTQLLVQALCCGAALIAGEALQTCTLVSTPYHWTFQMLWVLYWLTICLLVTITTWLLVVQPVRSAKKAARVVLFSLL